MRLDLLRIVPALALITLLVPGPAAGQTNSDGFERCGDPELVLVFLNPDLKVQEDGFVHSSGAFFIQFQARGERAYDIDTFKFSFGKATPESLKNCDQPIEWITGGYLKNYRSDHDWRDGFFVPINTYNVPDGEYATAISAYDAQGKELVRYFTKAIVDNGGRQTPYDPWPVEDFTMPWPMILPGDGERVDGGTGLYIEVAEEVSDIKAYVNGQLLVLDQTDAPERDDDVIPDLCYPGAEAILQERCEAQMKKRVWGPAYTWNGVLNPSDVVKVIVTDMWGNVAQKVVHLGDPTIGGRVVAGKPEITIEVDETTKETDDNGTARWNVTYRTTTAEGVHGDVYLRGPNGAPLPEGIVARLNPNHVMMGGEEELRGSILVTAGPEAPSGPQELVLAVEYLAYDTRVTKEVPLRFVITSKASSADANEEIASKTGTEQEQTRGTSLDELSNASVSDAETEPESEETPGPGLLAALLATGAALVLRPRRRG